MITDSPFHSINSNQQTKISFYRNLALLLPLQSGAAALHDILASPSSSASADEEPKAGDSSSNLQAGIRANHKALDTLLRGLDPQQAQNKCAVDLAGAVGKGSRLQPLFALNPVLGVGLRSWPDAPVQER